MFFIQCFFAQNFYKNKTNQALTFNELKSQFNDFKKSHDLSKGLPIVIVSDIEFNQALNKVYVSTFGRGIWETSITSIVTGVKDNSKAKTYNYQLYPTINDGNFTMEFDNDINSKTIELIDVMGKVVFSQNTDREKIELHLELNFGAYFVRISSNQLLSVKKIIVQ